MHLLLVLGIWRQAVDRVALRTEESDEYDQQDWQDLSNTQSNNNPQGAKMKQYLVEHESISSNHSTGLMHAHKQTGDMCWYTITRGRNPYEGL